MAATEETQTLSLEQEAQSFSELTLEAINWLDTKGTLGKVKSRIAKRLLAGDSKFDPKRLPGLFQDHGNFSLKITEIEAVDSNARITETQIVLHNEDITEGIAVGQVKAGQGPKGVTTRYERPGFMMMDLIWVEEAVTRLRSLGKVSLPHLKPDLTGIEIPELHGQPGSNF